MPKPPRDTTGKFAQFEATDKERELVAILAAEGVPQRAICRFVKRDEHKGEGVRPISLKTLKRHFRPELTAGREIADATIVNKNYELMIAGNPQVAMFMAKVRLGWKEVTEVHVRESYGELVQSSAKKAEELRKGGKPALAVVAPPAAEKAA